MEENCVNTDENSNQTTLIEVSPLEQTFNKGYTGIEGIFTSRTDTASCISSDDGLNNNHQRTLGGTPGLDVDDIVERTTSRAARAMINT